MCMSINSPASSNKAGLAAGNLNHTAEAYIERYSIFEHFTMIKKKLLHNLITYMEN